MNKFSLFLGFIVGKLFSFFAKKQEVKQRRVEAERDAAIDEAIRSAAEAAQIKAVQSAVKEVEKQMAVEHKVEQKAIDSGKRDQFDSDF